VIVKLRFTKMQGIGNDFAVVDCRDNPLDLDASQIRRFGDRHFGVGFDQLLTIESPRDASCAFRYGIFNADGSASGQCGNGARCVTAWLHRAGALDAARTKLESPSGPVSVEMLADERVRVDMGVPEFSPIRIPLLVESETDPYRLDVCGQNIEFGAVAMGNPHAVIEVEDIASAPLDTLGAALSRDEHFPEGCNVGFAQIVDRNRVHLRVWERGAGATLACGSGACAAVAVLKRRGKLDADAVVTLPGGALDIQWHDDDKPIWMTGAAEFVFEGEIQL